MTSSLIDVFQSYGLPNDTEVKIYRHADDRYDLKNYREIGLLDAYQAIQSAHRLGNGLVGFFMAEADRTARFIGMWHVRHHYAGRARTFLPVNAEFYRGVEESDHYYVLEREPNFDPLVDKLLAAWPPGRANDRWLVRPSGEIENIEVLEQS
ncbi:MAG TPA: hypothetical protein VL017_11255 [Devosia sp.]|nr:hypothetical protein [Devosia sp.]